MKRSKIAVVAFVVAVISLGFHRGWFTLSSRSTDVASHKVNVNLTVDRDKMQGDAETVKNKAAELAGKVTEEVKESGGPARDRVKPIN